MISALNLCQGGVSEVVFSQNVLMKTHCLSADV